jgi:hypothetical protein
VKTGILDQDKLFRQQYVLYFLQRLGFTSDFDKLYELSNITDPFFDIDENYRVIKLLISSKEYEGPFKNCLISDIMQFLLDRINKYPIEKYQDRMFFNSILFQGLIEINNLQKVLKIGSEA